MKTTVKGLTAYQRQLIVHIIALDNYSDEERAEHLKALDFCTDGVKHQALSELERTIKQVCKMTKQVCKMTKQVRKMTKITSSKTDGRKRWTHEDTLRLIEMYNGGAFADAMADAFKVQPNAIYARINWLKKRPEYRDLISTKKYSGKRKRVKA